MPSFSAPKRRLDVVWTHRAVGAILTHPPQSLSFPGTFVSPCPNDPCREKSTADQGSAQCENGESLPGNGRLWETAYMAPSGREDATQTPGPDGTVRG